MITIDLLSTMAAHLMAGGLIRPLCHVFLLQKILHTHYRSVPRLSFCGYSGIKIEDDGVKGFWGQAKKIS